MAHFLIKRLLQEDAELLFTNTGTSEVVAKNITFCNLSAYSGNVFLYIVKKGDDLDIGAVLSGVNVTENGYLHLTFQEKVLLPNFQIWAKCDVPNDINISIDIVGTSQDGYFKPPLS